jgi:Multicopper oxidase
MAPELQSGFLASLTLLLCLAFPLQWGVAAEWNPASTAQAPCGIGTPPPGHDLREFATSDRDKRLALEVKQDHDRLCYVSSGIAEAPVIRVRQGDTLAMTLTNEITDANAIARFIPEQTLDAPRAAIAARSGFIPVAAGMAHVATGITNLHLHGFPVPPTPPRDEVLITCADPAMPRVACHRRTISYDFQIPPNMPPGLYWYHPHYHGEVEAEVEMGLYGVRRPTRNAETSSRAHP